MDIKRIFVGLLFICLIPFAGNGGTVADSGHNEMSGPHSVYKKIEKASLSFSEESAILEQSDEEFPLSKSRSSNSFVFSLSRHHFEGSSLSDLYWRRRTGFFSIVKIIPSCALPKYILFHAMIILA